jgi:hypothetical protein
MFFPTRESLTASGGINGDLKVAISRKSVELFVSLAMTIKKCKVNKRGSLITNAKGRSQLSL